MTSTLPEPTQEQKARAFDAFVAMFADKYEVISVRRVPIKQTFNRPPGTGAQSETIAAVDVYTYQWRVCAPTSDLRLALLRLTPEYKDLVT